VSYNPFVVLHLDHIGLLTKDAHGNEYILIIIDAFSRWVELFPTPQQTKGSIPYRTTAEIMTKPHREACRVPGVKDVIVRDISARIVDTRRIPTLITRDDGLGAKRIVSYDPVASVTRTLSSSHWKVGDP
jgi:hypothetical protein